MLNNQQRREILNAAKATGHQGSVLDLFAQAEAGVDVPTLLYAEQDAKRQMEAQQMQVARTQQEQQVGLREEHARGNTGASMAFPDVAPNASFNTEGMKVPINISKFDQQGHLVQSFKDVPPGVQNLPTGPGRGTVIETPAYKYGGYKQKFRKGGPEESMLLRKTPTILPARLSFKPDTYSVKPSISFNPGISTNVRGASVHNIPVGSSNVKANIGGNIPQTIMTPGGAITIPGSITGGVGNIPIGSGGKTLSVGGRYTLGDQPGSIGGSLRIPIRKTGGPRKYQNAGFNIDDNVNWKGPGTYTNPYGTVDLQEGQFLSQSISGFPLYRDLITGKTTASPSHGYYARAYEDGQPAVGYHPGVPFGLGEAEVVAKKGKYSEAQQAKMRELMANNPDLTDDQIRAQVGAPQGQSIFDKTMSGLDSIEGAVGKTGGGILGQYDPTDPGMKALQDKMNEGRKNVAIGLSPLLIPITAGTVGPMIGGSMAGTTTTGLGTSGLLPFAARTTLQAPRYFGNKFLTHTGQAITGVEGGFGSVLGGLRSGQMTTQGLTQLSNLQRGKSFLRSLYY